MDFPPQANKWLIVRTGRRGADPWVAVHFGHFRFCFEGNASYLHSARKLEHLNIEPRNPPRSDCLNDARMYESEKIIERGVLLFAIEWTQVYVVKRRPMWGPDDYFIHAAKLMGEQGIVGP